MVKKNLENAWKRKGQEGKKDGCTFIALSIVFLENLPG